MNPEQEEASPMKAVSLELSALKETLRAAAEVYTARLNSEIDQVDTAVRSIEKSKKIPAAKLRDLRDMLTLLRHVQVKPEKGRRKDLKKLDSLVGDLLLLIENW